MDKDESDLFVRFPFDCSFLHGSSPLRPKRLLLGLRSPDHINREKQARSDEQGDRTVVKDIEEPGKERLFEGIRMTGRGGGGISESSHAP